jgi:protein-tyrosine phosphatase
VIDLHSHILPGVDDGPPDLEGSLAFARAAVATGTKTIAATPHINHSHDVPPEAVRGAVSELNDVLRAEGIDLEVVPGGEIALTRLIELSPEEIDVLHLGGGPYLLIESPLAFTTDHIDTMLFDLQVRGHDVLLAHPERSAHMHREPERLHGLAERGVLMSVTASSMSGRFGETVRRFTLWMFKEGLVHNVSSDAHDARRRAPGLLAGFEAADRELPGLLEQAPWFTEEVPAAVLAGGPIPSAPPPPRRKRRLFGRR